MTFSDIGLAFSPDTLPRLYPNRTPTLEHLVSSSSCTQRGERVPSVGVLDDNLRTCCRIHALACLVFGPRCSTGTLPLVRFRLQFYRSGLWLWFACRFTTSRNRHRHCHFAPFQDLRESYCKNAYISMVFFEPVRLQQEISTEACYQSIHPMALCFIDKRHLG